MKNRKFGVSVALAAVSLAGCATTSSGQGREDIADALLNQRPTSITEASAVGNALSSEYLAAAKRAHDNRFWVNVARLVLGTATTVTAGLDVDSETVFLLSAGTQSLVGVDTVINYGGVEAPRSAIATTRCTTRSAQPALDPTIAAYAEFLGKRGKTKAHTDAFRLYRSIPAEMMDGYVAAYQNYLVATTAPLLDVSILSVPSNASDDKSKQPVDVFATENEDERLDAAAAAVSAVSRVVIESIREC